jgi:hypothetical protein
VILILDEQATRKDTTMKRNTAADQEFRRGRKAVALDAASLLAPSRRAYAAFVERLASKFCPQLLEGRFDWTEKEKTDFGWPDEIARTLSVHMEKFEEAVSRYCRKPEVARLILAVSRHAGDIEGTESCLTMDILDAGVAAGKLTRGQVAAWWSSWHEPGFINRGQPPEEQPGRASCTGTTKGGSLSLVVPIGRATDRREAEEWLVAAQSWARDLLQAADLDEVTAHTLRMFEKTGFGARFRIEKLLTPKQLEDLQEMTRASDEDRECRCSRCRSTEPPPGAA